MSEQVVIAGPTTESSAGYDHYADPRPVETHGVEDHGPLHHHFEDMGQQRESISLGMWAFLSTEVMMFGGLFFVYTLYRHLFANAAAVAKMEDPFAVGSQLLNEPMGLANTFVLLFSSLTMAMAVHYATENNKKKLILMLGLTWLLGLTFLVVKGFEWTADWHEGLIPALQWAPQETLQHKNINPNNVNLSHMQMYFVIYFCMTGLHAFHMIIGLAVVGYFMFLANRNHFAHGNDQPVELVGLYWHFVDIVWVFLFPLLYLIHGSHMIEFFTGKGH